MVHTLIDESLPSRLTPWKTEANCPLHWQHFVPWQYPVLQAFPVKLHAPAKCYIWSFPSPWGSHTVNSYGFGVYSEIEPFFVPASYPQVSLKTRFLANLQKLETPKLSRCELWWLRKHMTGLNQGSLATSISSYEAPHLWIDLVAFVNGTVSFQAPSQQLSNRRPANVTITAVTIDSWAYRSYRQVPIRLSGYQEKLPDYKVFLSCKWSGPGRVLGGVWSCFFS